jgi:hypothetical protein
MLPWAFDPLKGSPAIPCSLPRNSAGKIVFPLLPEEVSLLLCRENARYGYGSQQLVETSCVPRRPDSLSARGQSANQSAGAVVPGPSSLRPLSPRGDSKTNRSQFFCYLSQGFTGQRAASSSLQQSFAASAWRRSTEHGGDPRRGDPPTKVISAVPRHCRFRQCRCAGAVGSAFLGSGKHPGLLSRCLSGSTFLRAVEPPRVPGHPRKFLGRRQVSPFRVPWDLMSIDAGAFLLGRVLPASTWERPKRSAESRESASTPGRVPFGSTVTSVPEYLGSGVPSRRVPLGCCPPFGARAFNQAIPSDQHRLPSFRPNLKRRCRDTVGPGESRGTLSWNSFLASVLKHLGSKVIPGKRGIW